MTIRPTQAARRYLTAIAATLAGHGITARVTRIGATPVLTVKDHAAGPHATTITIDPDLNSAPALAMDCTCIWTPAPGATPEATATTIRAVLAALRPAPPESAPPQPAPPDSAPPAPAAIADPCCKP